MPVVQITMTQTSKETKKEIIQEVTKAISKVTKEPEQAFTVVITEVSTDNFGVAGHQLTEMIKGMIHSE